MNGGGGASLHSIHFTAADKTVAEIALPLVQLLLYKLYLTISARFPENCMTRTLISTAILGLMLAAPALAGDVDFTLVNKTGYNVREVYVSSANKNDWGKDRMGDGTLDNGKWRAFKFSDKAHCKQDIKVVFDDSDVEVTWDNIDLCSLNKISLKYDKKTKIVSATGE